MAMLEVKGRITQPTNTPRTPEEQEDTPAVSAGARGWSRVRRTVVRERRVRFLLEQPADAPAIEEDKDAEEEAASEPEAGLGPVGPERLCSNGRPPAGRHRELQELEQRIEGARERLRQALLRRGELLAQLRDRPPRLLRACTGGATPETAR